MKRLFGSRTEPDDSALVICEAAIDALSYAAVRGIEKRRFVSTAGALSPEQLTLLRSAIAKLPDGGQVVIAVDADDGGDAIAEQLVEVHSAVGRSGVSIVRDSPLTSGLDWNERA